MTAVRATWPALLSAGVCLVVYALTLSPEVGSGDSAELSLQAWQLGVTHPPGYPVHTFLGKLFGLLIRDPAQATNWLSAIATAGAAGMLSLIVRRVTESDAAAVIAPLIFAFAPTVWTGAIKTEVYNVSVCLLAATIWFILIGRSADDPESRPSLRKWIILAGGTFGLSLGAGMSNLLLLPGLCLLVMGTKNRRLRPPAMFVLTAAIVAALAASWSFFRAQSMAPLGTVDVPTNASSFLRYLSATQYRAIGFEPASFYLDRVAEHFMHWGRSFLWMGILIAIVGAHAQWRKGRTIFVALLLMFVANLGYYTFHTWIDYREMAVPSYFVFAIWFGFGLASLIARMHRASHRGFVLVAGAILVLGMLAETWPSLREKTRSSPATRFVLESFDLFPEDAIVVTGWYKFTTLLFFQKTRDLRPDVRLVERTPAPRTYDWGAVEDVDALIADARLRGDPIVTDVPPLVRNQQASTTDLGKNWFLVRANAPP